jgi:hypothetical protein
MSIHCVNPPLGAWVRVRYGLYTHDGIVSEVNAGDMKIIHFSMPLPGGRERVVRETDLPGFLGGCSENRLKVRMKRTHIPPEEVVLRARQHLGAADYDVFNRNCQSFASWCYTGKAISREVQIAGMILAAVGTVAVAAASTVMISNARGDHGWCGSEEPAARRRR